MILLLISSRPIPRVDLSCGGKGGGGDWGGDASEAGKRRREKAKETKEEGPYGQGVATQGPRDGCHRVNLSKGRGDALTYLNVSSRETKTTPVNPRNRCAMVPLPPKTSFTRIAISLKSWKGKEKFEDVTEE